MKTRYVSLRMLSFFLRFFGVLAIVFGLVIATLSSWAISTIGWNLPINDILNPVMISVIVGLIVFFPSLVVGLLMIAQGDVYECFIDIEANTRTLGGQ